MNDNEIIDSQHRFYRDQYRRTLVALLTMIVIGLSLLALLAYQELLPTKPRYYATTTSGRVVPMQSLSMPVVTSDYMLQWAATAARASFNLDFLKYKKQLNAASGYFTHQGWSKFMAALQKSGVVESLTKNKLFMSAVVYGPVIITNRLVVDGRYTWYVQVPLLVTYTSANEKRQRKYMISMKVMRVPVLDVEKGIAINDFVMS